MSRWGCVSNPAPAVTMSSLFTSSRPWWVFCGSQCWLKEKECLESSHPIRVLNRSPARRTSTLGLIVSDMHAETCTTCHLFRLGGASPSTCHEDMPRVGERGTSQELAHARNHRRGHLRPRPARC